MHIESAQNEAANIQRAQQKEKKNQNAAADIIISNASYLTRNTINQFQRLSPNA